MHRPATHTTGDGVMGAGSTPHHTPVFCLFAPNYCSNPHAVVRHPQRLQQHVSTAPRPDKSVFLNNCKIGLHGPIEVISRAGVETYARGLQRCLEAGHGDALAQAVSALPTSA